VTKIREPDTLTTHIDKTEKQHPLQMKKLLLTLTCVMAVAGTAFAQSASFSLTDNGLYGGSNTSGTFNPNDTFTLSLYGSITGMGTGFTADGFSLWLEAPTASGFNTTINATSATYFQFTDPNQPIYPKLFTDTAGADANYRSDQQGALSGDLGATDNGGQNIGNSTNVHLADYTFSLSGAPLGNYTLFTTDLNPKVSGISFSDGTTFSFTGAPQVSYDLAVVPEPSTWAMGVLGVGVIGYVMLRRRRVA
jgi:hypothetical protein